MSEDPKDWREFYADINHAAVGVAMSALYDTYVGDEQTGQLRGAAVRAVAALSDALGRKGLIREMEQTPLSKSRRESPLWSNSEKHRNEWEA